MSTRAQLRYSDYEPRPEDIFHAVGCTSQDVLEGAQFRLLDLTGRVMRENEKLWRQLGPLVPAMQASKVKREFIEVLSVEPFLTDQMPYEGPNGQPFLTIEYLSEGALRLCALYGIKHPPIIEKVKRSDIPMNHGITLRTIHYSAI
jgi:hypothetical protein